MRKSKVLNIVPNLKAYRKDLRTKQRLLGKLYETVMTMESTLNEVEGVKIYNDFPLSVIDLNGGSGIDVISRCDDSSRSAYLSKNADDTWTVNGYRSQQHTDSIALGVKVTKSTALRLAKNFVSTGRADGKKAARKTVAA